MTMDGQKRKNPRDSANFISLLFYGWTIPLFYSGWKRSLGLEDLYPTRDKDKSKRLGDRLEKIWQREVESAKGRGRIPSLKKALFTMFWKRFALIGIGQGFNEIGLKILNPYLVGRLLSYFSPNSTMTQSDALISAGGIVTCIGLGSLLTAHCSFLTSVAGMQCRLACCSLVFRKAMRLSRTALRDTTSGQVVNLLSNDVARFDTVSLFVNFMWLSPISGFVSSVLLYRVLGPAGLIGVAALFLIVPLQSYTASLTTKFRTRTALRTDERVRLMDEIICGIQVLKMYAWEKPFSSLISMARRKEIKEITGMCLLRGIFMASVLFTTRFALFCTFISYVLMGNSLKASEVYIAMGFYNALTFTMGTMFVRGLSECAEAFVSISRLQKFLNYEEYQDTPGRVESKPGDHDDTGIINKGYVNGGLVGDEDKSIPKVGGRSGSLVFEDATACWLPTNNEDTLRNVTVNVKPGQLVAVIGPVGAGKSSLLQAALGELPLKSGKVHLHGRVSYSAQEPWVRGASIRTNIIFGAQFNRRRYDRVVRACALQTDLANFPDGDLTVVGERGASLSGGQRARINLARAVYREADIYLLDDPLSAVDVHVGRHLFEECIEGFLAGKTRILVTHQVQHLTDASRIIIMNNGKIEMIGTFNELVASDVDYAQLLQIEGDDDIDDDDDTTPASLSGSSDAENPKSLARALRRLSRASFKKSVSSMRSSMCSSRRSSLVDSVLDAEDYKADMAAETMAQFEVSSKGMVKGSLFSKYFKSGTNVCGMLFILFLFILSQALASGTDVFVGFWTNVEEARRNPPVTPDEGIDWPSILSPQTCVFIYTGIIVSLLGVALIRSFLFFLVCMRCSQRLHDSMFNSLVTATMRFFHNNPSGRILNRFSKDLGSIDELLPKALCDAAQVVLTLVGAVIVTATTYPLFLVPVSVVIVLFYACRQVYLRTSKEIKRMEGMTKSPVFSHLNSTLQGLSTIRAFNAQSDQQREFDEHQDMHTSAWFMFLSSSMSFGLFLDYIGLTFIATVCFTLTLAVYGMAPGTVGLAITQTFVVTGMVQYGIRQSAEAQNQLMAVERVLEYMALPSEPDDPPIGDGSVCLATPSEPKVSIEEVLPSSDWPQEGRVKLQDVFLWYSPQDPPVLRGLTLNILPQEKVGIVGRTGAGKSSMIVALFRMAPIRGKILLDGVDITTIPVQYLRSRISIIPQDPVLFSGTLRYNLDPFGQFPDYALWSAIEDVELKEMAEDMQGLDGHVQEGGGNLSVGQRQLLCLARAILRGNRILLLDEATANVDPQTDALIQNTIRTKFAHCTVLTVAHRLHTIMDSDKVLVMDQGKVAEFEHPHVLIQRHGILYGMVQDTGNQAAEALMRMAREAFDKKKRV